MPKLRIRLILLALAMPLAANAQSAPASEIWSIVCNTLKPGSTAEMMANESRWARAFEKAGVMMGIGMTNITGVPQACWISPLGTMENAEKMMTVAGKIIAQFEPATRNYAADTRMYMGRTRRDLVAAGSAPATDYRALELSTFRIRPGQDALFERAAKAYIAAQKRAGLAVGNVVILQSVSGTEAGVYWVIGGLRGLKEMDNILMNEPKVIAAMTADDQKLFQEFFEKAVMSNRSEIFIFNSEISALPPETRKAGGDFWKLPATGAAARKP